jgi:hypothetical protein
MPHVHDRFERDRFFKKQEGVEDGAGLKIVDVSIEDAALLDEWMFMVFPVDDGDIVT